MKISVHWRATALALSGVAIGALFLGGVAKAITDTSFRYSQPQTGSLAIPPTAFVASDSGIQTSITTTYLSSSNTAVCFYAPVNLPDGAKMTTLAFWYRKVAGTNFSAGIVRVKMSDGTEEAVVFVQPADTGGARSVRGAAIPAALQAVNNRAFNYSLAVCLQNSSDEFNGARITYTFTSAGD